MAKYERIVTTEAGLALLEKAAYIGGLVEFTALKTGDGVYDGSEDLANVTALKNVRQTIGIESVTKRDSVVVARAVLRNNEMTEGYTMTEIGLFAKDPDKSGEILYAIVLAVTGNEDYIPAFEDTPTSMTFELVMDITESAEAVTFTSLPLEGVYVSVETFNEHASNKNNPHGTTAEDVGARPETWMPTAADVMAHSLVATGTTSIPSNSDLNNYKTPGDYYVGSSSIASTIANAPVTGTGYRLIVEKGYADNLTQLVLAGTGGIQIYGRQCTVDGNWSNWDKLITSAGGTLRGNLGLLNDLVKFVASSQGLSVQVYTEASQNRRVLGIYNDATKTNLSEALQLLTHDVASNKWTEYKIYGEHNKPTASDVGAAASSHNQAASTITAGTFGATGVKAANGTDYTTARVRNIVFTTTDPGASASSSYGNGALTCVYE